MVRIATCPKCMTEYELEEDDIGHLVECECGVTLFACHTRSLNTFAVPCGNCGGVHDVRGRDVGRTVSVECGGKLRVPQALLRLPVGDRKLALHAKARLSRTGSGHSSLKPADRNGGADLAETRTASVSGNVKDHQPLDAQSGVPGGKGTSNSRAVAASPVSRESSPRKEPGSDEPGSDQQTHESKNKRHRTKPKRNIVSTLGVLGVLGLLLVAIVMFLLREPPSRKKKRVASNNSRPAKLIENQGGRSTASGGGVSDAGAGLVMEAAAGLSLTPPDVAPSNPVQTTVVVASGSGETESRGSGFRLPPPTVYALPEPKQTRNIISAVREKINITSLQRGMEIAFDAYGKVQKLQAKVDASNAQADRKEYEGAVGRAIDIIEQVHDLALRRASKDDVANTRYLLSFLYLKAAMLPEAVVMGEAVARWGDVEDPSTREAGIIALAAAQEMSDVQWGIKEDLGELRQMVAIAEVLQRRWPDENQNALIWMSIAYLYEAFNQPQIAVEIYSRIPKSSDQSAAALMASGLAEWNVLRQQSAGNDRAISEEARKRVKQRLAAGLKRIEQNASELSLVRVESRLALAQIELLDGNAEKAEEWLAAEPVALLSSIRVRQDDPRASAFLVDEAIARQMFDVMFHACKLQGDTRKAAQTIEQLSDLLGEGATSFAARRITILKSVFETLKNADSFSMEDFDHAEELSAGMMKDASSVPTATILWLAESWAQISEHTENDETAKRSGRTAAELFGSAIARDDFPQESLQAAQLRRIDLLRRSGEVMKSLKHIEEILAEQPNVFTLQIAAAQSLQQLAIEYERPSDLLAAIEGPSGFSPIWGWGKLVTTLHASMSSSSGNARHAEQLALAQYHLFWCRFQLASQIKDRDEKTRQITDVARALSRRLATMDRMSEWYPRYQELRDQMPNAK